MGGEEDLAIAIAIAIAMALPLPLPLSLPCTHLPKEKVDRDVGPLAGFELQLPADTSPTSPANKRMCTWKA